MKHIVLYSGGTNSAYVAWMMSQEVDKENLILLHTPTFSEHPDADRFRQQFADFIGMPITVRADGRNIWKLIKDEHCLPSERIPFCSRILKTEQAEGFYNCFNKKDITVYFGYGATEWRRAQRSFARMEVKGIKTSFPLLKSYMSDDYIKNKIKNEFRICLPEPYLFLKHNNCIPCFKGGKQHFYQVWKYYPRYFERAEEAEQNIGHTVFNDKSLTELKQEWQSQVPMFTNEEDLRPCMCAV